MQQLLDIDVNEEGNDGLTIVPAASEQMDTSNDASIDIEIIPAPSLIRRLLSMPPVFTRFGIYRVPYRLRQSNEKFYTPRVVSIGPLYHGKEELKAMEEYKRKCLRDFLQRTKVSLEDFTEVIKKNEARVRNCYGEIIGLNSHDFVKMILVDAAFIFEVFLRDFTGKGPISDQVRTDMILLENQIPFFILKDLFTLANIAISSNSKVAEKPSMVKLTDGFSRGNWVNFAIKENLNESCFSQVEHFIDFLRFGTLPFDWYEKKRSIILTAPSVTNLHQAGVKFRPGSGSNLLDIRFKDGVLEIPKIIIEVTTESVFRNLLAFEQYYCPHSCFINDYIILMNYLLNSSKDVELLVQNGIIVNWLQNSERVSILFHNLFEQTSTGGGYCFCSLSVDLNRYRQAPWHKWMLTLKQNYFSIPWASVSVMAAVILLVLAFIRIIFIF